MMQATIAAARQRRFREFLKEGSVYSLSGFDVARSNTKYRVSDAAFSIRFNDGTLLAKIESTDRTIPTEIFRFRPYNTILGLGNRGEDLPDVLGELTAIKSTITDGIPGAQRVMLTLRIESEFNVCVSMFDAQALALHRRLESFGREPRVVLVTGINPKIVSGNLYLNGTSATHFYFDSETAAGKALYDSLPGGVSSQSGSPSKVLHSQKIEPLTVAELNQFVIPAEPQIIEFLCTAKVTEIQKDEGWCYIGCSKCSKKLIREETSFTCVHCNESNPVAELRYRVILCVSDASDTAFFLGFDTEIAKLTLIRASESAQIVGIGINAEVDTELPQSLAGIVGNTYTFQMKLKDYNFTPNHKTFTISRIFPAQDLSPKPTFDEGEHVSQPSAPQPRQSSTTDTSAEPTNVGGEEITGVGLPTGGLPASKDGSILAEKALKRPRVE
ncbi:unnamed protein product [Eruca vesicaria subsp. sativa]|uniref:Replication factor A C-terminal domain-containing protein n=1 Tax=Eruca vesicaria subsp. sativa TaxID=29727 RepID=A0ABC8JID3_ERUVS|nr:unnamed protein product [Eruca vesicaria subsp. sativa]